LGRSPPLQALGEQRLDLGELRCVAAATLHADFGR
jgi:hypothetical protein